MNTPDAPGYYWFKGTGVVVDGEDYGNPSHIHGIIQLDWWFDRVEPYFLGDYVNPETMNGIWSEKLISPFGEDSNQDQGDKEEEEDIILVSINRKTIAIIQDMALNYFDPAAGKYVLDWIKKMDNPES